MPSTSDSDGDHGRAYLRLHEREVLRLVQYHALLSKRLATLRVRRLGAVLEGGEAQVSMHCDAALPMSDDDEGGDGSDGDGPGLLAAQRASVSWEQGRQLQNQQRGVFGRGRGKAANPVQQPRCRGTNH